jgi:hypothetical protein
MNVPDLSEDTPAPGISLPRTGEGLVHGASAALEEKERL